MERDPFQTIDWNDTIKKEARGTDDSDFGEVQDVGQNYVLTQRGTIDREKFYVPKYLAEGYDGDTVRFNATENDLHEFVREGPPSYDDYMQYRTPETRPDIETRIPVIEERLDVTKKVSTDEVTISKEPVTEEKTMEVPITHEELTVERRPVMEERTPREGEKLSRSRMEVKVPLTKEEVEVSKQPYVKEEVVVRKEPVTETKTISDTVTSERVNAENLDEQKSSRKTRRNNSC
jgi:uncharacterized protein (TIGR02271 family)